MKKFLALMMVAGVLSASLVSCGDDKKEDDKKDDKKDKKELAL